MVSDAQVELLSASSAARLTGLSRNTVAAAMDRWSCSHGRQGLRYVQVNTRRLIRRSALLDYLTSLERIAAHGE